MRDSSEQGRPKRVVPGALAPQGLPEGSLGADTALCPYGTGNGQPGGPRPRPTREPSLTPTQSVLLGLDSPSLLVGFPAPSERDRPEPVLGCLSHHHPRLCHGHGRVARAGRARHYSGWGSRPARSRLGLMAGPLQSWGELCRNHSLASDTHTPGGDRAPWKVYTFLQVGDPDSLAPQRGDGAGP